MPLLRHFAALLSGISLLALAGCGSPSAATRATPVRLSGGPTQVASPLPRSYAALGASETYGVGATPFTHGYAYLLARALGAKHFRNTGIPGATLSSAYDAELASALSIRPRLCTVFFGVNDLRAGVTVGAFRQDLYDLVVTLRRAHARVLIIGMPNLAHLPAVRRSFPNLDLNPTVSAWNGAMRGVAHKTGAEFLNLDAFTTELAHHPGYIAPDGLHPSNAGHARLARVVLAAIHTDHLWSAA